MKLKVLYSKLKCFFFILFGLSVIFLNGCNGCRQLPLQRHGIPFKIKGRVLDQYDHPVPNAPIAITLGTGKRGHSYKGDAGAILTDLVSIHSNDDGTFEYDSAPVTTTLAGVSARDHWGSDGSLFWLPGNEKNGLFEYREDKGWYANTISYNGKIAPHDEIPQGGPLTPETVVIFRVSKSGGPEPMAEFRSELKAPPKSNPSFGIDLMNGTATSKPCPQCDLTIGFTGCDTPKDADFSVTIEATQDSGVQLYGPRTTMSRDRNEAPVDGYNKKIRMESLHGILSDEGVDDAVVMFYAKDRKIYGRLHYDFLCFGKERLEGQGGWKDRNTIAIIENPRGDRNLNNAGIRHFQADPLALPLKQLPYRYISKMDPAKIEVIEDKAKSELTVHGTPGALPRSDILWIENEDPEQGEERQSYGVTPTDATHANSDGSFDVRIKANLRGNIYLRVKYKESPTFEILPLARLLKPCEGSQYYRKVSPSEWPN